MNFLERIGIKTAIEGSWKLNMACKHDTSTDFGQFNIVRNKHLPKGKYKIAYKCISNMQPMPQPTFGEVEYNTRFFWVPWTNIFKGFNDFLTDNDHIDGNEGSAVLTTLPYTYLGDLTRVMANSMSAVAQAQAQYTFTIGGTTGYYKHTAMSKWTEKFLKSLRYGFLFNDSSTIKVNIMNILAAAKVYIDYYYNNAYINDNDYIIVKKYLERDNSNLYYSNTDLENILRAIHNVFYKSNYFVSAWDTPNHPNIANQQSSFIMQDPNGTNPFYELGGTTAKYTTPEVSNASSGDPAIEQNQAGTGAGNNPKGQGLITQWAIDNLRALTMYLKRNQLAGASTLQRLLARYGIEPIDERMKYCKYLGKVTWGMNVSPIFSNADTAQAGGESLGSYAGTAFATSGKDMTELSFETDNWGTLVMINTVIPKESYLQGFDKDNMLLTKTDLWTPEFDNLGVEAVTKSELVLPEYNTDATNTENIFKQTFGFLPRYANFKVMHDLMSGNYTDPTYRQIFLPYVMQRKIDPNTAVASIVHSKNFTLMTDGSQYDRIFYSQPNDKDPYDNFNLHHEIIIEGHTNMKPLYDYYDWEHEGGNEVEIKNNGAPMY